MIDYLQLLYHMELTLQSGGLVGGGGGCVGLKWSQSHLYLKSCPTFSRIPLCVMDY